ncbi:MAG: flagellar basal body-associated FliL family protein [Rhodospirillales bacterium]|nr:flagellar basal body-associated FliL family protein [Rhodospirillales bacterium]
MSLIMGMAVLTGLSVGAGGMFGLQVLSKAGRPPPPVKTETKAGESLKGRFSEKAALYALAPIITNLASPERTWIRLEASIVIDGEGDAKGLAATVTEDTVAYLRTLSLPLIEGASGLLHLREDLNDRARIRSGGKVRDLIIHTLIVE